MATEDTTQGATNDAVELVGRNERQHSNRTNSRKFSLERLVNFFSQAQKNESQDNRVMSVTDFSMKFFGYGDHFWRDTVRAAMITFVCGYLDGNSVQRTGVFITGMSGNFAILGTFVVTGNYLQVITIVILLLCMIGGTMLGRYVLDSESPWPTVCPRVVCAKPNQHRRYITLAVINAVTIIIAEAVSVKTGWDDGHNVRWKYKMISLGLVMVGSAPMNQISMALYKTPSQFVTGLTQKFAKGLCSEINGSKSDREGTLNAFVNIFGFAVGAISGATMTIAFDALSALPVVAVILVNGVLSADTSFKQAQAALRKAEIAAAIADVTGRP